MSKDLEELKKKVEDLLRRMNEDLKKLKLGTTK